MGDDLRVANAARVSFDKESEWDTVETYDFSKNETYDENVLSHQDTKLIKYLAKHNHFTPFTHTAITLRETVPIFVARQRFKHVVGFTYNEVSRRYVDDAPEFYRPTSLRSRAENKKQGSGEDLSANEQLKGAEVIEWVHRRTLSAYSELLSMGVAPEQARMVLPQSMYTSYYVTGSLAAFARAYGLRSDPHAQLEIQELAKTWDTIIRPLFPVSWSALID